MVKKVLRPGTVTTIELWLKQAKTEIDSLDAELILVNVLQHKVMRENELSIEYLHTAGDALELELPSKIDRSFLFAHGDYNLPKEYVKIADQMVAMRKKQVPLAYLIDTKEFYGRNFYVTKDTLIPRPESETIIELAVEEAKTWDKDSRFKHTILDVGTGSGCLAITMALEVPEAYVIASDISPKALEVAKANAERLDAEVDFYESDLLKNLKLEQAPDILIANLPYVDPAWEWTSPELTYEPELALYAKNGGLDLIYKLLAQIMERWQSEKKTHVLLLEADPIQHKKIIGEAVSRGFDFVKQDNFILEFKY